MRWLALLIACLFAAPAWAVRLAPSAGRAGKAVRTSQVQFSVVAPGAMTLAPLSAPTLTAPNPALPFAPQAVLRAAPAQTAPPTILPQAAIEGSAVGRVETRAAAAVESPAAGLLAAPPASSPRSMPAARRPGERTSGGGTLLKLVRPESEAGAELKDLSPAHIDARLGAAFDGAEVGPYLREDWATSFGAAESKRYMLALADAGYGAEGEKAAALVDAGAALAESAGIRVRRRTYPMGVKEYAGFEVLPLRGASRLNEIAYRLKKDLDVSMDFIPERTRGATAMFNTFESRLYLPSFTDEDSYAAILHEARHAYYKALLVRGETRLFHFAIVPLRNQRVAPNAYSYAHYLNLEELTTYPKTLRHAVMRIRKLRDPARRAQAVSLLKSRIYQYAEIIDSTKYVLGALDARERGGTLEAQKLHPQHQRSLDLGVPAGGAQYAVRVWHAFVYIPVEAEAEPNLWRRWFGRPDREALAVLGLRRELLRALLAEVEPVLDAFADAVGDETPDWARGQMLADRLVVAAQKRDEEFVERYARLRGAAN